MSKKYDFDTWLQGILQDPAEAEVYLNEHLCDDGQGNYEELLLLAFRNIALAFGMDKTATAASLSRETLYRTLSAKGNPRLKTITKLLSAWGLELRVCRKKSAIKESVKIRAGRKAPARKKKSVSIAS